MSQDPTLGKPLDGLLDLVRARVALGDVTGLGLFYTRADGGVGVALIGEFAPDELEDAGRSLARVAVSTAATLRGRG